MARLRVFDDVVRMGLHAPSWALSGATQLRLLEQDLTRDCHRLIVYEGVQSARR